MSEPLAGTYADPVLDGIPLTGASAAERVIRGAASKRLRTAADGSTRVQLLDHGAGLPMLRRWRRFTLRWPQAAGLYQLLERILSHPGEHQLATWKVEWLAYAGDGARTDFTLFWPSAIDTLVPPPGRSAAELAVEVRLGPEPPPPAPAALPVTVQPTAAYDAGSPPAGEAWIEAAGPRFKLGTAPAVGETVIVRIAPLYRVVEVAEEERSYRSERSREPRDLELVEVA